MEKTFLSFLFDLNIVYLYLLSHYIEKGEVLEKRITYHDDPKKLSKRGLIFYHCQFY